MFLLKAWVFTAARNVISTDVARLLAHGRCDTGRAFNIVKK